MYCPAGQRAEQRAEQRPAGRAEKVEWSTESPLSMQYSSGRGLLGSSALGKTDFRVEARYCAGCLLTLYSLRAGRGCFMNSAMLPAVRLLSLSQGTCHSVRRSP